MKLGEFFLAPGRARRAPVRTVKFVAVRETGTGEQLQADIDAQLVAVPESKRAELDAEAYAATIKLYGLGAPRGALLDEETYRTLAWALRDVRDPSKFLVETVEELKAALLLPVARKLAEEYQAFMTAEYPTRVTPDEKTALVEAAKKNS